MSDADKTEKASPERVRKARAEGQFARSRDGTQVAAALAVMGLIFAGFPTAYHAVRTLFRASFSLHGSFHAFAQEAMQTMLVIVAAPACAAALAAIVVGTAQAGFRPNMDLIAPNFGRFTPLSHLLQIISWRSAGLETIFTIARVAVVGGVTVLTVKESMPTLVVLCHADHAEAASAALTVSALVAKKSAGVLLVLSVADYVKSKLQTARSLRMTKQEVKDEHKRNEGDGKIKQRIIARGRERIRKGIRKQVKLADVIVVNPTHVSVALRYRASEGAPTVVAKGYDEIALFIRKCAREEGIPIVPAPPLARALAKRVKVGRFVPQDLWSPVAEILAFVYRLKNKTPARPSQSPPS